QPNEPPAATSMTSNVQTSSRFTPTADIGLTMDARTRLYPETRFGGYSRRDGTVAFYTRVNALLTPSARVLDYGCGVGAHINAEDPFTGTLQRLRGKVAEVIGVDVDGAARNNPNIDRFYPTTGGEIPL